MVITEIHVYQHDLPVVGPAYTMSQSVITAVDTTLLEIVTDSGLSGFGETCPLGPTYQPAHALGARAALAELAPHLIGQDPTLIGTCWRVMEGALAGHNYAKAALDTALWDLLGKVRGLRVCDLLGGAVRERVPSYAAIGLATPEDTARQAQDKQAAGFERLQLKVGGRDVAEDIAAIRKVFEIKTPQVRIAADANRGWTTRDALTFSLACQDLPLVIEQPCASYEENRAIRPQLRHPLYLDENMVDLNAVMCAIHDGVADGFGMKITRVGGLTPFRTIREICHATKRPLSCDDSWGGDIIASACLHMGATIEPSLSEGVWIAAPYIEGHYDPEYGIGITDGWLELPKGPGLGIRPQKELWGTPVSFS